MIANTDRSLVLVASDTPPYPAFWDIDDSLATQDPFNDSYWSYIRENHRFVNLDEFSPLCDLRHAGSYIK